MFRCSVIWGGLCTVDDVNNLKLCISKQADSELRRSPSILLQGRETHLDRLNWFHQQKDALIWLLCLFIVCEDVNQDIPNWKSYLMTKLVGATTLPVDFYFKVKQHAGWYIELSLTLHWYKCLA